MRVTMTTAIAAATIWAGAACAQSGAIPSTELATPNSNNETVTHVCTDQEDLSLSASNDKVTLTGACHSLLIRGSGNKVSAEQPLDVTAIGSNNAVTWKPASAEPHLHFEGEGNSAGAEKR